MGLWTERRTWTRATYRVDSRINAVHLSERFNSKPAASTRMKKCAFACRLALNLACVKLAERVNFHQRFQPALALVTVTTDARAMWLSTLRGLFDIARWLSYDQKCIL
jgi:hypothetical protein